MTTEAVARVIGLVSQGLFSSRIILQWIKSERAKQVLVPALFWQISLISSFLMIIYGILRHDEVLILGNVPGMVVYTPNIVLLRREKLVGKTPEIESTSN